MKLAKLHNIQNVLKYNKSSVRNYLRPTSSVLDNNSAFKASPALLKDAANNNFDKDSKTLPEKARGIVSSIIHGSPEVVHDHEKSTYSKIIARGKYVHRLDFHFVKPEAQAAYSATCAEYYPKFLEKYGKYGAKLCGSWLSELGDLDKSVHIWEFEGYAAYDVIRTKLQEDKEYIGFQAKLGKYLNKRESQMCLEFAFWATSPPKFNGGVYELRSYLLKPGRLLEWEQNWKIGLECRRQFNEPVGAWFSQLGDLNYVHHMWKYPTLNRENAVNYTCPNAVFASEIMDNDAISGFYASHYHFIEQRS